MCRYFINLDDKMQNVEMKECNRCRYKNVYFYFFLQMKKYIYCLSCSIHSHPNLFAFILYFTLQNDELAFFQI